LSRVDPGRLGAATQLLFAAILGALAIANAQPSPEPVPRGLAVLIIYGVPGLIGYLGAVRGSAAPLVGAALVDIPGSVLSWSFVTLIFLVPAILMGAAAAGVGRAERRPAGIAGVVVAAAIAALLVGGGVAFLFVTEPLCWITTTTGLETSYQVVPTIENIALGAGQSGGCTGAATTLAGAVVGAGCELLALAIAWRWTHRVRPVEAGLRLS
jgi:hypothetical protein